MLLVAVLVRMLDDDDKWLAMLRGIQSEFWHQTVTTAQVEGYINKVTGFDFGLVFAHEPDLRLTAPGKVAGTPGFMAPEQASGQFDQRSDLYALGCVGFFLLTGRSVFQGPNPMAILLKHATEAPPAPSSLAPGIPAELDALILDCLSKRPSDRPGSASELWARLGQVPLERPWTAARAAEWWKAAMAKDSGPTDRAN